MLDDPLADDVTFAVVEVDDDNDDDDCEIELIERPEESPDVETLRFEAALGLFFLFLFVVESWASLIGSLASLGDSVKLGGGLGDVGGADVSIERFSLIALGR